MNLMDVPNVKIPTKEELTRLMKGKPMPNINDLKESRFLTQHDVEPPVFVTIAGYEKVDVSLDSGPEDNKWTLRFLELDKPLVLNYTNGQLIAQITGSVEFDKWKGKKIVLYRDPNISFGGKIVGGIRCRAARNQPSVKDLQDVPEPHPAITTEDDSSIPF